ncbi:MAG: response regulator [Nitrospirota bacterium]
MAHRLLLADDSITIQKVVELILAEEDFEIKSVSNGEDALNALDTFRPEIVLADIEMPKINGYQLCEKIKENPSTSNIPVILLAGAFEPIDEDLSREVGADDSIIKPFESQELISKINAALTMVSAGEPEAVEAAEAGEELEFAEDLEGGAEEAVEVAELEEDLWAMEEIPESGGEVFEEAVGEEERVEPEETYEIAGEEVTITPGLAEKEEFAKAGTEEIPVSPGFAVPSNEELLKIFEKTVDERISSYLSDLDIRDSLLSSLMPAIKDSIEKILWEIAPELVEKMLKEILKGSISSLTAEVEKVIWETVPDLAGTMISKEIEKIKSEF